MKTELRIKPLGDAAQRPLVVVVSMSIGHMIGMLAVALYLLAIVVDMVRSGSVEPVAVDDVDDLHSDAGGDDRAANPGDDDRSSS